MENKLVRRIKKPEPIKYLKSYKLDKNNENNGLLMNRVEPKVSLFPFKTVLKLNCSENVVSGNSSLMCSHEKLKIECNISSGEVNGVSSPNCLSRSFEHNSNKITEVLSNCLVNTVNNELLTMDDSLLEKVDLSFNESSPTTNIKKQCFGINSQETVKDVQNINSTKNSSVKSVKLEAYGETPDIFSNNVENNVEEDIEDKPWDMSVSVIEDKDRTVSEEAVPKNSSQSQGLSEVVLSTWVYSKESPPAAENKRPSFEDLVKNTLTNNAHKRITHYSSPRSLFTSSSLDDTSLNSSHNSFFGLPENVKRLIKRFKGISSLYKWQEECLCLPAIEKRKNLVYALPTSGGKTLVAEILILKEVLCRDKNVLLVLPYVSIAQEKVRALSPFAVELGFLVEEYAGSKGAYPPQKRRRKRSVYVATIEKALGLVHSLIECQRIQELGLVVVDELHLIGEPKRGAHLESMLTKLMFNKGDVQIVGMSATIGNLSDIASFLEAEVYTQDFRPVELTEFVKVEDELFRVDHTIQDEVPLVFHSKVSFQYSQEQKQKDPDQIGALVQEVVPDHSCLVFCPSKKNCENVAMLICNVLERNLVAYKIEEKKALFRALVSEGNGTVCPILRKTLPFGVAYHHSGLTTAERNLLEEAFLAKTICCICCTSTLAAGVNLPARRVILRSPYVGVQLLTLSKYKQMIGRAGRTGMGDFGESFLICKPQDTQKVGELLSSSMDVCKSQLQGTGLACLIISGVDLGLAPTTLTLHALCRNSLLAVQAIKLNIDLEALIKETVETLDHNGALEVDGDKLALSKIGKAAVKANVDMDTARRLYRDLKVAQDSLVLLSHMHILYLVTPYTMMDQIAFHQQAFCNSYMELGPKEMQAAKVLGIGENCIALLMRGKTIKGDLIEVLHRFYLSLILFDLWNQNSIWKVSNKYSLPRGLVHNFLVSASAFSSSVVRFCEVLDDMWCFKLLLSEMSCRLTHCCTMELIPLMELPAVKIGRAKQLYNAGFKTLSILAKTEPKTLAQAVDHMPRRVAHQIVAAAKLILLAKAESLQEEAEDVLEGL